MILSHNHKFVFIHIGRTGGTSIENVLCRAIDKPFSETKKDPEGRWWKHAWAKKIHRIIGNELWNEYFTFSFVRNPYDMILSLYSMYTQYTEYTSPYQHPRLYHPWNQFDDFEHFILSMGERVHQPDDNWRVSLDKLNAKTTMDVWDSLRNLQTSYLTESWKGLDGPGEILVKFVGRYENLEDDFRKVCNLIGLEPIALIHHGGTCHNQYQELYNNRMRSIVYEHFKLDIERFDYRF